MNEEKWQLNRAGIINFWYYDVAYFDFADGKLLLRGANGSGKSVTMSSLITVLLDGRKSPDRLDPFGSSARKMEDYLLGEEDVSHRSERTGYLFLEYKRKGLNQYMTTGMGMQARRHKSLNTWYFVMTDNRRIGIDLDLYRKASADEIVPLTRQELSNRIGGRITSNQKEYMGLVNELIFGFDNSDIFDDLIKLLVQLRRPKLSKDFKPTVIYDILRQSLPALKDDDLHSVADTLEQLDQARQQLEQRIIEKRLMEDVTGRYLKYHDYCVAEMALHLNETSKKLKDDQKELQKAKNDYAESQDRQTTLEKEAEQLNIDNDVLTKERDDLQKHEVFRLVSEKAQLVQKIKDQSVKLASDEEKTRKKQNQVEAQRKEIEKNEWEGESLNKEVTDLESEMTDFGAAAGFTEHINLLKDYERQKEKYDFQFWRRKVRDYASHLGQVQNHFKDYERKREEVRLEDRRLGEQYKKVADLDMEVRQWNRIFTDERSKLEIGLQNWRETVHFSIDDADWADVLQSLNGLYDEVTLFDDVLRSARDSKEAAEKIYRMQDAEVSQNIEQEKTRKQQLTEEKAEWLAQKEPEPERSEETRVFREKLREQKIEARPLYELIDFSADTPQRVRNHLEAALLESGYLDALISEQDLELASDKQLKPKPFLFAQTLSEYLVPNCPADSKIPEALVQSVIDSIQLEGEDSLIIDEKGTYRLPSLVGQSSETYETAYIGKASREAFRNRRVEQLNQEIADVETGILALETHHAEIIEAITLLDDDMQRRPSDSELKAAFEQREEKEREREQANRYKEEIEQLLNTKKREEGLIKNKLNEMTENDDLSFTLAAYQEAEKQFFDYREAVNDFIDIAGKIRHVEKLADIFQHGLSVMQEEYDDLFRTVNDRRTDVERQKRTLESVEERLKLKNADDVRQRMEEVIAKLERIGSRLPDVSEDIGITKAAIRQLEEKIGTLSIQVQFFAELEVAWKETFLTEYKRYQPENEPDSDSIELIKILLKGFKLDVDRKRRLSAEFENKFREMYGNLLDYRLEIVDRKIVQEGEWTHEREWPSDLIPRLEQWREMIHQQLFECDYQGSRSTPQMVIARLKEYVDTQSVVLDERDQQLFEDIILHSVGVTLRSLIDRSEKWVKHMNQILVGQENSSDLTLSVAWKPKIAETEDELDTQELVSLLRRDAQLLTQEDLEKMIRHFRAKIEACKLQMLDEENTRSLDQVLKEVLDYRGWFTFELSFKRKNESKKELTNHRFYKFSGGEKAISMYLPLYTAVFARYQDAGKNAPFIIALDEAFAGVDELNIAEQFKAIEQLGFNYMMNSQALFGDYETVPALNIYELIRPKNANYVSVIAYHWNGKERQLIDEEESQQVLSE